MDTKKKKSFFNKFLDCVEVTGNKMPHPVTLFVLFSIAVIVISEIAHRAGTSVIIDTMFNNRTKQMEYDVVVTSKSLMNAAGLRHILNTMTSNFTSFAPLGTVLVAMIGVGVAEGTGLIQASLRKMVLSTPKGLITAVVVFAGIMSNIASDAGYVVLVPLGAVIFLSFGRHPLAGLAAAFAGVSGGFSANLLIGTLDPLLGGISTEAARILDSNYAVLPTANYYFMFVSTFVITIAGVLVTEKLIEPRLGKYKESSGDVIEELNKDEKKGLLYAGISLLVFTALMLFLTVPQNALLRVDGNINPFINKGLVPTIMFFFFVPGLFYGIGAKTIKNDKDVAKLIGQSLGTMGGYLALSFTAAQFINYFAYTNLGTILAVSGADFLKSTGFTGFPLIITFVLVAGFINLFIGSASAKWAIMAPVFIPMFMQLGLTPEFTQVIYRIGDSTTNIISPLMAYFAIVVAFAQKYDKDTGIGTLISTMLPYSMVFLGAWTVLLVVWYFLGLPLGPGISMFM